MRKRFALPLLAAVAVALPVLFAGTAQAHGYTTNPISRSALSATSGIFRASRMVSSLTGSESPSEQSR